MVLLAATPVLAIAGGASARDVIAFGAAIMLASAAMAPQAEITPTVQLLKRFSLAMLFPIAWMVLQIAPLPFESLVNPIWSTASMALNEPSSWGHVSIGPGNTLRSLILYSTILALVIATVIVTRDRQRAETILFGSSAVTTFMSAEILLGQLNSFAGMLPAAGTSAAATFVAASALGTLANSAALMMAIERHLSRRDIEGSSSTPLFFGLCLGLVGVAICMAAMWTLAPSSVLIAMAFGLAVMLYIAIVRRLAFRPWFSGLVFAIFAAMAAAIIMQHFQGNPSGALLRFATSANAESLALAQRALSDSRWLGSGVGTFMSLAGIYQDFGAVPILEAPTTAVSLVVEWGQVALVILVLFAIQLFAFTFRGALRRGRDSFYPAAAAASVGVMLCEAFCDPGLMHPAVQILAAVMVGLGLSQSVGRTSGPG
jgi:hypothetical protein